MTSVIIATYNGEKYVIQQLTSIARQSRQPDEVIIVDDCSSDRTVIYIKEFIEKNELMNWIIYENKENIGYTFNFFKGISLAAGDIIFLCDQDDIWNPDKVEVMAGKMEGDSNLMVLSSRYSLIDENGNNIKVNPGVVNYYERYDGSTDSITVSSLIGTSYIRGCAMCFRKELVPCIPNIELSHLLGHDWMINILGALKGKNECINLCLSKYRIHSSNASLSAVSRNSLIGDRNKRILGLEESINAHSYIVSNIQNYSNFSGKDIVNINRQIKFEKKRLRFLKSKNIFLWLTLISGMKRYKNYYHSNTGAIKVWIGDFLYAYNINFNVR